MKHAVILTAILTSAALAGCTDTPTPLGEQSVEVEPGLFVGAGNGVVRGTVADAAGFPLQDARVSILSTDFFAKTDGDGRFQFVNVSGGQYRIQVLAPGHSPWLDHVSVAPGNVTTLAIRMLAENADPTGRQHLHDYWGGATTYALMDQAVPLTGPREDNPMPDAYWAAYFAVANPAQNLTMWRVPIVETPDGGPPIVLPGTAMLSLTADWSPPMTTLETMGWCFLPTNWEDRTNENHFLCTGPKPSPAAWDVTIDPRWHDSGHAAWSQWELYLYTTAADEGARPGVAGGSVDVSVTLHRGDVPPEPPHPTFWQDGASVVVHEQTDRVANLCCSSFPVVRFDEVVPPGTTRVTIEHTWKSGALFATAGLQDYQVLVRTAGMNPQTTFKGQMLEPDPVLDEGDALEGRRVYELELGPLDADPFYLSRSAWRLSFYNQAFDRDMYDVRGGTVDHTFTVTAHNDDL